jgi:transcriptional regulator with XRE-family HTH domain
MIGDELKAKRKALGLTTESFAQMVGVSDGRTVRRWEKGDREIPGSVIVLLELSDEILAARQWLLKRAKRLTS